MKEEDWISLKHQLPPNGVIVNTMNSAGQITELKHQDRLWFIPDGSVHVYYEPQFWKPIQK